MKRLIVLVALLLAGCSAPDHGYVTEKKHHDPYTWVQMSCVAYGKGGTCTIYVPIQHHVRERWELCLRDDEDKRGCRDVDSVTWGQYKVGDYYEVPGRVA